MHQVLFTVPIFKSWFPPDGVPIYGFGAMLFITFIACTIWGSRRAKAVGMPPEKLQDMVIVIFVSGIVGARVLYMIQYANQFPDQSIIGLIGAFFQIWKGGIIFYGSALGGAAGYGIFYWSVLRKMTVSGWQLADALAPIIALGLAIGRIGCFLNGCCWGQVAIEETCPVPLGGAQFPLLPAHARDQLVRERGLQTSTGFTIRPTRQDPDPRSIVAGVEPHSPAAKAGLKPGDRIIRVNGRPNAIVVRLHGSDGDVSGALAELGKEASTEPASPERVARAYFDSRESFGSSIESVRQKYSGVTFVTTDLLSELVSDWPRGQHKIQLAVQREGEEKELSFEPVSVPLYPTQLYETVSMALLILLLVSFHPFRRHDGQVMVLLMVGYALHRFINESIRIEPTIGMGLTLSQWGSVVIFLTAIAIETYLWWHMPSRWSNPPDPQREKIGLPTPNI